MAHPQHAPRRLAHRGKGFGQDVVERLAGGEPFAEFRRLRLQRGIVERLHLRLEGVDLVDDLAARGDVAVVGRAEKAFRTADARTKERHVGKENVSKSKSRWSRDI